MDHPLAVAVLLRDARAVGQAISLVEQSSADDLLQELQPRTGRAMVIGVTGPPGSGKSTLVDALVAEWRSAGLLVAAVLADPSSPLTGGAMLGDRIRMSRHALDSGVFIRSLADRGHGGGLPGVSAEVVAVLDAAGFDVVLVETVGVGQSELDVVSLSDHVLLVCHPESGDGMQAMKSGILELADTVVVNKADLDGAWRTSQELKRAARVRGREVEVMLTIAQAGTHVAELGSHVMGLVQGLAASGELEARRRRQLTGEVRRRASALRARHITQVDLPPTLVERLHARQVTPALAALELLALIEGAAAS